MGGRGKRLDLRDTAKMLPASSEDEALENVDFATVEKEIDQINVTDLNYAILMSIRNKFNHACSSRKTLSDLLSFLHEKTLLNAEFGEKLVVTLEEISNTEQYSRLLRGELLTLIQNDFEKKEIMCSSDPEKFMNAVTLLGNVYNKIKVCGAPIAVLGFALLEYLDLLIDGGEEELKTATKQILLNGKTLFEAPAFGHFQRKLRDILLNNSSSFVPKCWILLIIDLISNDFKPLKEPVNEFYVSNLKDSYTELMSVFHQLSKNVLNHSPQTEKSNDNTPPNENLSELNYHKRKNYKKKLEEGFSGLTVNTEFNYIKDRKHQNLPNKNLDCGLWKSGTSKNGFRFEHDDRFEKEENYYGVQAPREEKVRSKK